MSVARYRDVDPSLPWMGGSSVAPRRLTGARAEAVMRSREPLALALMLGYARSYAGASGGAVGAAVAGGVLAVLGRREAAAAALAGAGACALAVIETRRRARQWEAVIGARLATLGRDDAADAPAVPAGEDIP